MTNYFALAATQETNFFQDIWNYLYSVYLNVDGNYSNLGFDRNTLFSLRLLVLGLFVGTIIACIAMAYNNRVLGGVVKRLFDKEAHSPESALTYTELGYKKNNFIIRHALATSITLRRVVKCAEEEIFYSEQNNDMEEYNQKRAESKKLPRFRQEKYVIFMDTDRFYIPEEAKDTAKAKFNKKGSGLLATTLSILALCIVFIVLLIFLPVIFNSINTFFGELGTDPNIQ